MSLSAIETARLLTALLLLVATAHGVGLLFSRLRQPPVIGEVLGGLLLGPTVLGMFLPRRTVAALSVAGLVLPLAVVLAPAQAGGAHGVPGLLPAEVPWV